MTGNELDVIKKSKDLMEHTFRLTSNCNRFPKKFRFSLVDRMQLKAMDIYECLEDANCCDIKTNGAERWDYQRKAINHCKRLLVYIELSNKLGIISVNSMEYWSKMVTDIKYMTMAWRKSDCQRK